MQLKALFLNCTLKKSPETSNTEAFIGQAREFLNELNVVSESVRLVDYQIDEGTSSQESETDEWPLILEKVKACDILIIATPVWRGDRSSVAKKIAERFDGIMKESMNEKGQYPTFNKVGGVMVDGNEDGAKRAVTGILLDLSEHGFSIPINAFAYYVGKAGEGASYIEAEGNKHEFTVNMLLLLLHHAVHLASILKANPYPTDINALKERAKAISSR